MADKKYVREETRKLTILLDFQAVGGGRSSGQRGGVGQLTDREIADAVRREIRRTGGV